ncbi:MAG: hypothetical protein J0I43_08565 [Microbacterium sp.]|uniref:hypothetical protein n=1 Tax=Microbacterium sp. TaxID=51671 RepID=UPI001AC2F332|nr:hypothetical protein [Microbacterium sp.]MBN9177400.1 hypothetical protein [Microbacterium sp.]
MSDEAETIYELRDGIVRDAQTYAAAAARPLPATAVDDEDVVRVELGEDGTPVVTVRDGWLAVYEPSELSGVVLSTLARLGEARTEAWATGLGEEFDAERANVPLPALSDSVAGRIQASLEDDPDASAAVTAMLERVLTFLDDVAENVDASFDAAVRRGQVTTEGAADGRHVVVRLAPTGELRAMEMSERWLEAATPGDITRQINAAIEEAGRQTPTSSSPLEGTPLGEYQRFVDDPDAFVRYLRGKD